MFGIAFIKTKIRAPYVIMLSIYTVFVVFAFITETPAELFSGLWRILTSPSVLVTDFIAVGGLGAALLNSAIVGFISIIMLILTKVKPNGAIIAAMWLTMGFTFFGKNIFNMIPLTCGVWLFAKYNREPFTNYTLAALLVATLSPTVSEISFLGILSTPVEILLGVLFGFLVGFIFPAISAGSVRLHGGYDLYNMGFAGGLICMIGYAVLRNAGVDLGTAEILSEGNTFTIAVGLYLISAALLLCGLLLGGVKENFRGFLDIQKRSGRLVSDFFFEHGNGIYINMAALGVLATTIALLLRAELNGLTIAGILTIIGFGGFGKHVRNVTPIMAGAILAAFINTEDTGYYANIVAILFSTGLAPIAGQYGLIWGVVAGFLHLNVAMHTAYLSGGMNLYANGFAAGFVAMFMLPLITALKKEAHH